MPVASVPAVERLRVDAVQVPHPAGEVRIGRLAEQVVGSTAVRDHPPAIARAAKAEDLEEALAVSRVAVDGLPLVATRHDVEHTDVEHTVVHLDPRRAREGDRRYRRSMVARTALDGLAMLLASFVAGRLPRGTGEAGTWKT